MPAEEQITITVNAKGQEQIQELTRNIEYMGDKIRTVTTTMTKMGGETVKTVKKSGIRFRMFRMEMLSVMFAGMQLKRAMTNLLQPAMDVAGVFDVWGEMLTIIFLPAALLILDAMLWLWDIFEGLPEPIKNLIPYLALFGLGIGSILSIFGSLSLAMGGLKVAFPFLGKAMAVLGAPLAALMIAIGILIVVFTAMDLILKALGLPGLWEGVMKGIENLGRDIQWLIFLAGEKWKIFRTDVEIAVNNVARFIQNLPANIKSGIDNFVNIIAQGIISVVNWFKSLPQSIYSAITSFAGRLVESGRNMINWIIQGIQSVGSALGNAILNLIPQPFRSALIRIGESIGGFFFGHRGFIRGTIPYVTKEGGYYEPIGNRGMESNTISIQNPIINITSAIGRESTEVIVREIIEKLGMRLVRI